MREEIMKKECNFPKRLITAIIILLIALTATAVLLIAEFSFEQSNELTIEEALELLMERIDFAEELLENTYISHNGTGSDVPRGEHWVTQATYDALKQAIEDARAVAGGEGSRDFLESDGIRVSMSVSQVSEKYIDVTLSLDKNRGIRAIELDLFFDLENLTPVSLEGYELDGFTVTTPPLDGGFFTDRRVFVVWGGLYESEATGLISTTRFEVTGDVDTMPLITIGYFEAFYACPDSPDGWKRIFVTSDKAPYPAHKQPLFEASSSGNRDRGHVGNVNNDNVIDFRDVTAVAELAVGRHRPELNRLAADIDGDGLIRLADATRLARHVAGEENMRAYNYYMSYRLFTNSAGGTPLRSHAEWIMDQPGGVADVFMREFRIKLKRQSSDTLSALNMRSGCPRFISSQICGPDHRDFTAHENCGNDIGSNCSDRHHRSAHHFVRVPEPVITINTFRFVNYGICSYDRNRAQYPHDRIHGAATAGLTFPQRDMIVSIVDGDWHASITTAHEISHLLGARDDACSNDDNCVMHSEPSHRRPDKWCAHHRNVMITRSNLNFR
jgi:hypothetical protein